MSMMKNRSIAGSFLILDFSFSMVGPSPRDMTISCF
jgi:hypothetical protein